MEINKKLHLAALATITLILFLISISFSASAVSSTITETQIATGESANLPDIYGNNIVWQNSNYDRYINLSVYNLSTHRVTQITTSLLTVPREPKIYGDRIVWIDSKNGSYNKYGNYEACDIYLYNLSTSAKTQITTSGSTFWPTVPEIYGDRIVWSESRDGSGNVYMYNLSTKKETRITNKGGAERPAIYNDKIVWEQVNSSTGGGDICCQRNNLYVYDISTNNTTKIIDSEANYYRVAIYGDKIAWQSWINGGSDIHVYDLSTGKDTQLTNNREAYSPDIYEDRVVWEDWRNRNADIYMYNLSTSEETRITMDNSNQRSPAIYEKKIVWQDEFNGSNIHVITIFATPVANFSSNVTKGYSPLSVQFTDLSENATGWNWNFGDGVTSTGKNPVHAYSEAGTYIVKLTATDGNENYSAFDTINVLTTSPCAYVTSYYGNNVSVIDTATNNVIDTVNVEYSPVAFGQFIGEKPVLEPLLPVPNLNDNVTPGVDVEQTAEPTQSSDTSGKGSTKMPGFEIVAGIYCLLGAFLYKQNKKR